MKIESFCCTIVFKNFRDKNVFAFKEEEQTSP